jgi:Ni/Co efflux regulator RcnB
MKPSTSRSIRALVLAVAGSLALGTAVARDNDKHGKDDRGSHGKEDRRASGKGQASEKAAKNREHFGDDHRAKVRDYYGQQYASGRCPPGLAKKNNGCMPPGQAKKWQIGHTLPSDVVFYSVPQPLVVQIGQPPSGYRYVRVASDILLIAIGSGMIIDAIQDLGR